MNILDRIIRKEEEFFMENVRDAKYLIMSPYTYAELLEEVGDDDPLFTISKYEGLIVAVTNDEDILDIEVS